MFRSNPVSDLIAERQRAVELERFRSELPSLIQDRVGEHIRKLETKLVIDFKEIGQKAIIDSTTALNEQLSDRIGTLERISALQTKTIGNLRDSSKVAEQKVGSIVHNMEQALAEAVPGGFQVDPPEHAPNAEAPAANSSGTFCPNCTSTNIRRANRSGPFEQFLRLFFLAPFRCRACRHRFYRF